VIQPIATAGWSPSLFALFGLLEDGAQALFWSRLCHGHAGTGHPARFHHVRPALAIASRASKNAMERTQDWPATERRPPEARLMPRLQGCAPDQPVSGLARKNVPATGVS